MASKKDVTGAEVRAWAIASGQYADEACLQPGARGRLSPTVIDGFHKANPNKRYGKVKVAATVTLPVPHETVKGFATRQTEVSKSVAAEARSLVGLGKRGALSEAGATALGAAFATFKA